MGTARQNRGRRTNVLVADWLVDHGWPEAKPTWGSEPGQDVKGIPGFSIEVKARANFDPRSAMKQAKDNAGFGEVPTVIIRMNGQGDKSVGEFYVIRALKDDVLSWGRGKTLAELGQIAYEAYCTTTENTYVHWDYLTEREQLAWIQSSISSRRGHV